MNVYETSVALPRPRNEVFEYLRRPANLLKLFPTQEGMTLNVPEVLNLGDRLEFSFKTMGQRFDFVHEIIDLNPYDKIALQQVSGPFKAWQQEQYFSDGEKGDTLLKTVVTFEPPGGLLGFMVTKSVLMSYLQQWIPQGNEVLRQSLAAETTVHGLDPKGTIDADD